VGFNTFAQGAPDSAYSNETITGSAGGLTDVTSNPGMDKSKQASTLPICGSTGQPCTAGCGNTPAGAYTRPFFG